MYVDPAGKPYSMEILSFFDFPSVGPVLVELLKRQGIDATYGQPPDIFTRYFAGEYNAAIFGHGGSVHDPFETFGSTNLRPRRSPAGISSISRAGRTPITTSSSTKSS